MMAVDYTDEKIADNLRLEYPAIKTGRFTIYHENKGIGCGVCLSQEELKILIKRLIELF
jgi:hypothetical protein